MKKILLALADIPLEIKYNNHEFIPSDYQNFTINAAASTKEIWHLASLDMGNLSVNKILEANRTNFLTNPSFLTKRISLMRKRFDFLHLPSYYWQKKLIIWRCFCSRFRFSPNNLSFYFNEPVEINTKEKKIRHFRLNGGMPNEGGIFASKIISFAYSQILAFKQGFLLHCACISRGGEAYLFFAPPGGGKSTVAQLSKQYLVLGDDIIAVRKIENEFFAFATPWAQKGFIKPQFYFKAKVKAVFFLKKSKRVYFKSLKPEEALVKTLSSAVHFFRYTEIPLAKEIFFTLSKLFKVIPSYEMYFKKDDNFWPILEKTVKSND